MNGWADFDPDDVAKQREAHQRMIEEQQHAHEVANHEVARLFRELTQDQLVALSFVFDVLSHSESSQTTAGLMNGRAVAALEFRFGRCSACGDNHDESLKEMSTEDEKKPVPDVPEETPEAEREYTQMGTDKALQPWEQELMDRYNLDDLRLEGSGEPGILLGFMCKGCKMQSPSIADRILAMPGVEGCSGCQQKARWG